MSVAAACPRCGNPTVAGTRYEANGTVDVRICLTGCGFEVPPFGPCCDRAAPAARQDVFLPPDRKCQQCAGALRLRYPADLRRFCSQACAAGSHVVPRISVTCPCGTEFEVLPSLHAPNPTKGHRRGIYCSKSCAARFWARRVS